MELFSSKSIIYGLFTPYEGETAIQCFQSDFEELFWAIENLSGIKLKTQLIKHKVHFSNRYQEQPDKNLFAHVNIKLMTFLELAIDNPTSIKKQQAVNEYPKFKFSDFFKSSKSAKHVISSLIDKEYLKVTGDGFEWVNKSRNSGKEIAALFNYLIRKEYLKPEFSQNYDLMAKVVKDDFKLTRSAKTFKRMNDDDQKGNWSDFRFLS